jgi:hypothetical protein
MAPGSGKSLASQFSAVFLSSKSSSFSIIISPLQTTLTRHFNSLTSLGIFVSISHETESAPVEQIGCLHFMKPEDFLNSRESIKRLSQSSRFVSIVVEDAHLVCDQSHSSAEAIFRQIRLWFPEIPIVALVDLRHPSLLTSLTNTLGLRYPQVIRTSLNRSNLFFSVKCLSAVSLGEYLAEFYRQCESSVDEEDDGPFQTSKPSALVVTNTFSDGQKISSLLSAHPILLRLGIHCDCQQQQPAGGADSSLSRFNRDLSQILIATHSLDFGNLSPGFPGL